MKYFISQPMNGRTNEEIAAERNKIIEDIKKQDPKAEIIDSFFLNAPYKVKPLWFLGKSLELLSAADIAYFAQGWENARGCKIEHDCADRYGIISINL